MVLTPGFRKIARQIVKASTKGQVDRLAERVRQQTRIAELAENGRIAIVYGGIDCDGGRWDNRVALVPATVVAVNRWIDRYHFNAEGPQWQTLARPSEVADLREDTRDLALEAFEDGHAHVLFA